MSLWDKAAELLGLDRTYIKQQFYIAVYTKIHNKEQERIVTTMLKLGSPLSYKAETIYNKKRRGNYGLIRQTGITET
jgi:hypothetical protein